MIMKPVYISNIKEEMNRTIDNMNDDELCWFVDRLGSILFKENWNPPKEIIGYNKQVHVYTERYIQMIRDDKNVGNIEKIMLLNDVFSLALSLLD